MRKLSGADFHKGEQLHAVAVESEPSPKGWLAFHQVWQDMINVCSAKFRGCEQSRGLGDSGESKAF